MLKQLKDKKVIFFDVGNTLDRPASGHWMFTNRFLAEAGDRLKACSREEYARAWNAGLEFLTKNHLVTTVEAECRQFSEFYSLVSRELDLGLTEKQCEEIARDRTYNMENYIIYPDAKEVIRTLSKTHRLGIISDTWPSIENQLRTLDVLQYFSFTTYSFALGVFKPDRRMYLDALEKCGCDARETVFIDDSPRNLEGAAGLGITPILIAANPASDVETPYMEIRSLSELI